METIQIIALSMGAAWASGVNLYAAVFMLGILGGNGYVDLPSGLESVTDPLVVTAAGIMFCIEFIADKIPGVDSVWDTMHTFIRIPAGALLSMAAVGDSSQALELTALLLGGTLSAGTHATKAGTRLMINTSPEPFSNWTASITEDILVIGGVWTALYHPWVFLGALIVFIIVMIWLLPKIIRTLAAMFRRARHYFRPEAKLENTTQDITEV